MISSKTVAFGTNGDAAPASHELTSPCPPPVTQKLYLKGRPTLKRFIRFVRDEAVKPPDEATLITEWQAAKQVVGRLTKEEAGCADNPRTTPVPVDPTYEPLLTEFLKDPLVQHNFNTVPTEVAFVELDSLVVYQKHIDLTFVEELKKKLGPAPGDEEIFRACLPYDHPQPPAEWSRLHDGRFVFMSPSNDIRFLKAMALEPRHITGYAHPGALVGVVGLAVGFGSNFLNAIRADNRLILNNGSHRAYALRDMGFTHVPCVIQHVSTRDELDVVAAGPIRRDPDVYLKHPRPSMLKDYFNPELRRVMPVHRRLKQITVKFEVDDVFVPAL
ncbi:MAG TPA: hypothetical protein VG095_07780 [Chthoniobacterales bacterium]|nr:hypothetical protein [Chthoniobacterales bacterium]